MIGVLDLAHCTFLLSLRFVELLVNLLVVPKFRWGCVNSRMLAFAVEIKRRGLQLDFNQALQKLLGGTLPIL